VLYTKDQFVSRLNALRKEYEEQKPLNRHSEGYRKGYLKAMDDVLHMIEREGSCFIEEY